MRKILFWLLSIRRINILSFLEFFEFVSKFFERRKISIIHILTNMRVIHISKELEAHEAIYGSIAVLFYEGLRSFVDLQIKSRMESPGFYRATQRIAFIFLRGHVCMHLPLHAEQRSIAA